MAVEARHLNHFPPQLIDDSYPNLLFSTNQGGNHGSAQQMLFLGIPSGTATLPENPSLYHPKTSGNTDSGLTYASRKRSRDDHPGVNLLYGYAAPTFPEAPKDNAGEDFLPQFQQYQSEIDAIFTQHAKKIRSELEERQKQHARLLAAAIGQGVMKKVKEKDEQIQKLGKLNLVLQERMKSLYVENQLLRDLAQTNEATANSLRTNLEQVLQQAVEEDVESCCGSSDHHAEEEELEVSYGTDRKCRKCGERESSVLLLPCRHLCLCSGCGSGCGSHQLQACPVCNCTMTATLHVNMSPQ